MLNSTATPRSARPCFLAFLLLVGACGPEAAAPGAGVDHLAETYVKLVLSLGEHDADYVDAYYGPEVWRQEAEQAGRSLQQIRSGAESMTVALAARLEAVEDENGRRRLRFLQRQLEALVAHVDLLLGRQMTFDEEARALYDAVPPSRSVEDLQLILDQLDRRLGGEGLTDGPLSERYEAFRQQFVVPRARLDEVFQAAIGACRQRTEAHIDLPDGERFVVEYVGDKSWSGYNWYQGDYHSLIQINTDLPIHIDRIIDLACHEGYPGHHVFNVLIEKNLVQERGWLEFTVYPLFSPHSFLAEGSANFGIDMAFPRQERVTFERQVLFPLADLDPAQAAVYYELFDLKERVEDYAEVEAARRYLNGEMDTEATVAWLRRYALQSPSRAAQKLRFFDQYRSYIINYSLGEELVRAWVEGHGGTPDRPGVRWREFERLLSLPHLPSELAAAEPSP